jgi:toxin ParE1/3/4
MSQFKLTPAAESDLIEIIEYIASESPIVAVRIRNELHNALARLADFPGVGHFRLDLLNRQYKFWSVYSYVIVYRWKVKPIQVIAVLHGARDLEVVLARRRRRG